MVQHEAVTPDLESPSGGDGQPLRVAGLLAEFDSPESLVAAAARVRDLGYTRWDAHTPFPVHGLDRAMGIRPTVLPWLVLGGGLAGCAAAILLQWWTNAVDYPLLISGKPLFSLPANIPIAFELIVLASAITAFVGVLGLNRLPRYWNPLFRSERFGRATDDRFFLTIDASDPRFDPVSTREVMASLPATAVETCYTSSSGRTIPPVLLWAVATAVVMALVPPAWIARSREVTSPYPRIHPIRDMDFQPRYEPQGASPWFDDGRAMRAEVPGAVSVGRLDADDGLYRGRKDGRWVDSFPMAVNDALVQRGRQRYNIFCAACHGLDGDGNGMVGARAARRAEPDWVPPRSVHVAAVVEQPLGQLFNTITHGVRAMPGFASQISPEDRWAILLYVRALQRSGHARQGDVPPQVLLQLK